MILNYFFHQTLNHYFSYIGSKEKNFCKIWPLKVYSNLNRNGKKITVSHKKAKKLTVSRKKAKILTVNGKSPYPIETLLYFSEAGVGHIIRARNSNFRKIFVLKFPCHGLFYH